MLILTKIGKKKVKKTAALGVLLGPFFIDKCNKKFRDGGFPFFLHAFFPILFIFQFIFALFENFLQINFVPPISNCAPTPKDNRSELS